MDPVTSASQRHRAFIAANWEALAALAWRGYLRSGRGALQVPESLFIAAPPGDILLAHVDYVHRPVDPIADVVRTYDPEREIVCTITGSDGGTSRTYQLRGPVSPPDAYEQSLQAGHQET